MADAAADQVETGKKRSLMPLIGGAVLALALGGVGFYATWSGLILSPTGHGGPTVEAGPVPLPDIAFVPVDPIVISLGRDTTLSHLRFTAQLEVAKANAADVALLMPRIIDVINGYLRAVAVSRLENPGALVELRAQMLRRIQMVTGEGRVRDLLVTEFVLN
ncbi:flagellar basal body-associated FliL family protein [Cereibacter azotoformans]|uniref:Flagellar protein FliL n=2 Tax=Cereibacter TaxID=1653176 RepID=A0A2T5K8G8_9RHOB|nr:flagellar basal body-associated FliL family protein [Cereibacter azotoformans]AXQ94875.1 flagellar basal body protein FliL [Cereibacter sphaeroides]MBO4170258.1 flagellar basal body-associated FliL family protein [Cereibacter azotoformans]PTR18715.1 flagellar FliL protein [Cereibacter azotoformans]UIJ30450.1 flagellar basal body-associated FliL family protein [Cereibacter azotoformans]ULB11103.1 flagellar basal body-associated FliL family protein [Cereibacter azotoformans]